MPFKNYRTESREQYGRVTDAGLSPDEINAGCMLRIADAVEKLAADRVQMEKDLAWYKYEVNRLESQKAHTDRSMVNLRGQITKLKKKNQCLNNQP